MLFPAPAYLPNEEEDAKETSEFLRIWNNLVARGSKKASLLLADIVTQPESYGLGKSVLRHELIKIVASSLAKAGYIGKPEELRTQEKFRRVLMTKQQEGGIF